MQTELCTRLIRLLGTELALCVYDERASRFVQVETARVIDHIQRLQAGFVDIEAPEDRSIRGRAVGLYGSALREGPVALRPILKLMVRGAKRTVFPVLSTVRQAVFGRSSASRTDADDLGAHLVRFRAGDLYMSVGGEWTPPSKMPCIAELRSRGSAQSCPAMTSFPCSFLICVSRRPRTDFTLTCLVSSTPRTRCSASSKNTMDDLDTFIASEALRRPELVTIYLGADGQSAQSDAGSMSFLIGRDFLLSSPRSSGGRTTTCSTKPM